MSQLDEGFSQCVFVNRGENAPWRFGHEDNTGRENAWPDKTNSNNRAPGCCTTQLAGSNGNTIFIGESMMEL